MLRDKEARRYQAYSSYRNVNARQQYYGHQQWQNGRPHGHPAWRAGLGIVKWVNGLYPQRAHSVLFFVDITRSAHISAHSKFLAQNAPAAFFATTSTFTLKILRTDEWSGRPWVQCQVGAYYFYFLAIF